MDCGTAAAWRLRIQDTSNDSAALGVKSAPGSERGGETVATLPLATEMPH